MIIKIKTSPSKFFFSGDIYLNTNKELEVDTTKLTKTQLLDIIEAYSLKNLSVSNIAAVRHQMKPISMSTEPGNIISETSSGIYATIEIATNTDDFITALNSGRLDTNT